MSIATQILRLNNAANIIKNKMALWGLTQKTDKLDEQANAINNIGLAEASGKSVNAGESVTISVGYNKNTITIIGNGLDTQTPGTADSSEILNGETAWVNGEKITGSLNVNHYYTGDAEPDETFGKDGDIYLVI